MGYRVITEQMSSASKTHQVSLRVPYDLVSRVDAHRGWRSQHAALIHTLEIGAREAEIEHAHKTHERAPTYLESVSYEPSRFNQEGVDEIVLRVRLPRSDASDAAVNAAVAAMHAVLAAHGVQR